MVAVRDDLTIVHVTADRAPGLDAPVGGLPPGRSVLVFTLVHVESGWLAAATTNTPIAALPSTAPV